MTERQRIHREVEAATRNLEKASSFIQDPAIDTWRTITELTLAIEHAERAKGSLLTISRQALRVALDGRHES